MKRFFTLLFLFIVFGSSSQAIELELTAGLAQQNISGYINNVDSKSKFKNDLSYDQTYSSLFSLELRDMYIPNIKILYMNTQESATATLQKSIVIAKNQFDQNSSVFSEIEYKQFNAIVYKEFLMKGTYLAENALYSGDLEIDLGVNTQYTKWNFNIKNMTNTTQPEAWIHIKSFIASPYLALKYYLYNIKVEIFGDALAYKDEKVLHYGVNLAYTFDMGIVLSVGYNYNEFELTEHEDKINYASSGVDFMFGYRF